jgi:iron(III) transport system permease protein
VARRFTLLLGVGVLCVAGLLPLLAMLAASLTANGELDLSAYRRLFVHSNAAAGPLLHSATLAAVTAVTATLLGVPMGVLLGKTDLPLRRLLTVVLSVPLVLPPYVLAMSWFNLVSPDGLLNGVLSPVLLHLLSDWLLGLPGCLWVLIAAFMPLVMLLTQAYLRAVPARLEEAGRLITAWPAVLRFVTLPLILPGILFSATLVFLLALGETGVPMFLRYPVFPVEVLVQFSAFYDTGAAAAAATPLLAVATLLVALEHRYLGDRVYRLRPTASTAILRVRLRGWRLPLLALSCLVAAIVVALPLLALCTAALRSSSLTQAWLAGAESLGRSLVLAGIGATLLTVVGFLCGYLIERRALRIWRALDTLGLLLFTLPGAVIGVGLIVIWNRPGTEWLYGSVGIVALAYLAQYNAITTRITAATLANVPRALEEAAAIAGAPWPARIRYIVIPAIAPGLIAAWMIAFIFCIRDLGASMLLYPPGRDTLSVRIFTLMANGAPGIIAGLCMMLVLVTLGALATLALLLRVCRVRA